MPTRKSSSTKKKSSSTKAVGGMINFHKPGEAPQQVKIKAGTTLEQFIENYTLSSYDVFVNGDKVGKDTVLKKGDTVRIGIKTKNA